MSDREAFEKWARRTGFDLSLSFDLELVPEGYYGSATTRSAWNAWQAAQTQTLLEVIRDTTGCPTKALQHSREPVVGADCVQMPTNVDQARAMAIVGTNWLKDHAPDQLIAPQPVVPEEHVVLKLKDALMLQINIHDQLKGGNLGMNGNRLASSGQALGKAIIKARHLLSAGKGADSE